MGPYSVGAGTVRLEWGCPRRDAALRSGRVSKAKMFSRLNRPRLRLLGLIERRASERGHLAIKTVAQSPRPRRPSFLRRMRKLFVPCVRHESLASTQTEWLVLRKSGQSDLVQGVIVEGGRH